VRTVFYMGPLVATRYKPPIKALSARLLAAGKGKVAPLVTMLNALRKPRKAWQAQEVQN
jgi:hypothetical protein